LCHKLTSFLANLAEFPENQTECPYSGVNFTPIPVILRIALFWMISISVFFEGKRTDMANNIIRIMMFAYSCAKSGHLFRRKTDSDSLLERTLIP